MSQTYVVTGAAGFIGSHIAERLLRDGQCVRVIDNLLTGRREHLDHLESLGGDLTVSIGSITELDGLQDLFRGADYVFASSGAAIGAAQCGRSAGDAPALCHGHAECADRGS